MHEQFDPVDSQLNLADNAKAAARSPQRLRGELARSGVESGSLIQREFETSGGTVHVNIKVFSPDLGKENKESPKEAAVIFLPGYSAEPDAGSLRGLNEHLAISGKQDVHCMSTRIEQSIQPDSLYHQAEAVAEYIEESGLKEVTLVGYSNGGAKSVHLAKIIKERSPEVNVRGLVLMNAVSIYEQDAETIKLNFFETSKQISWQRFFWKKIQAGAEVAGAMIKEIFAGGYKGYRERIENDVAQMIKVNPSAASVEVPIVLIYGSDDKVSNPHKFIPDAENEDLAKVRAYLQDELFQSSPGIYLVTGEKDGHHAMPEYRDEEVAKVAFYLLQRHYRNDQAVKMAA